MAAAQVLHESRVHAPWAKQPPARRLLQRLADEHSFYMAPHGSNDDWYWMYAAVRAGVHASLCSRRARGCCSTRSKTGSGCALVCCASQCKYCSVLGLVCCHTAPSLCGKKALCLTCCMQ